MTDDQNNTNARLQGEAEQSPVIPTSQNAGEESRLVIPSKVEGSLRGNPVQEKNEKKGFFTRPCKECEKLKIECEEYKTNWHRALADYQNLQKETATRRAEWAQMSEQQILEEFIPVYEHLKAAFGLRTTDYSTEQQKWIDGIAHIMNQFNSILKSHGVEEIKTVGEKFNPELHEAVGHEPMEGAGEDEIIKEISGGYTMGGRVIKAARVIVAK